METRAWIVVHKTTGKAIDFQVCHRLLDGMLGNEHWLDEDDEPIPDKDLEIVGVNVRITKVEDRWVVYTPTDTKNVTFF